MTRGNLIGVFLLFLPVGQAIALVDQPPLKAGYWSVQTTTSNSPGGSPAESKRFVCRNPEFDQWMRVTVESMTKRMGCKIVTEKFADNTYTSETHCAQSGSRTITRTTSVLTGDSAMHTETVTTFDPALNGLEKKTLISEQKWIGACPAGAAPGDNVSTDGQITHLWRH